MLRRPPQLPTPFEPSVLPLRLDPRRHVHLDTIIASSCHIDRRADRVRRRQLDATQASVGTPRPQGHRLHDACSGRLYVLNRPRQCAPPGTATRDVTNTRLDASGFDVTRENHQMSRALVRDGLETIDDRLFGAQSTLPVSSRARARARWLRARIGASVPVRIREDRRGVCISIDRVDSRYGPRPSGIDPALADRDPHLRTVGQVGGSFAARGSAREDRERHHDLHVSAGEFGRTTFPRHRLPLRSQVMPPRPIACLHSVYPTRWPLSQYEATFGGFGNGILHPQHVDVVPPPPGPPSSAALDERGPKLAEATMNAATMTIRLIMARRLRNRCANVQAPGHAHLRVDARIDRNNRNTAVRNTNGYWLAPHIATAGGSSRNASSSMSRLTSRSLPHSTSRSDLSAGVLMFDLPGTRTVAPSAVARSR